jgi:putative ABC transport system substrate-binding protein
MKRRGFISLLGGATVAWPFVARAQQSAMPLIGYLSARSSEAEKPMLVEFHRGLREAGYVGGQNIEIDYRFANGHFDQLPPLAAGLVRRKVAVIAVLGSTPAALAAKAATMTIPIVFQLSADPVEAGLVASLKRPGGNLTGVANLGLELGPKRLELMRELVPTATVVALLVNPTSPIAEAETRAVEAAAQTLGLELHVLHASTEPDLDAVFAALVQLRASALVISPDGFFTSQSKRLSALSLRARMPAIYGTRQFAVVGGLMSYGGNAADAFHTVGVYTGRILKGERPADLPVQQSTKTELVINIKTAEALGLTIPLTLRARADEVVE